MSERERGRERGRERERERERDSLILYLEDDGFRPWPNLPTVLASLPYTQTCTKL